MSEETTSVRASLTQIDERYSELRLVHPRREAVIEESMKRQGQLMPLVATERREGLAVVDGFKRLHGARRMGMEAVEVRVLALTEQAAVAAVYGLNSCGRGMTDYEEALIVKALCRGQGMAQTEVAVLLGRHKSWVCRRLGLIEQLSEQVREDLQVGLVSVTVARELARLPRGNQPEVAQAVFHHGLTSRDTSELVTLFEQAKDRGEQKALLSEPRDAVERYRGRASAAPHDTRLSVEGNRLRRRVLSTVESADRLLLAMSSSGPGEWTVTEGEILRPLLALARSKSKGLVKAIDTSLKTTEVPSDNR